MIAKPLLPVLLLGTVEIDVTFTEGFDPPERAK
jgi:hypothetical protein